MTVKHITTLVHRGINELSTLITLMDTMITYGVEDNDDLERILSSSQDSPLMKVFNEWCKENGVSTAEEFTTKIEEWEERHTQVLNEVEDISTALNNIECL